MLRGSHNAPSFSGASRRIGLLSLLPSRHSHSLLLKSKNDKTSLRRTSLVSISPSFQSLRYFRSSSTVKNTDVEKAFWQWLRATGSVLPALQLPDKMPYEKGKYVTGQITKLEAEKYLYPLYMRGWEVRRMGPGDDFNTSQSKITPFLVSRFVLKSSSEVGSILAFLMSLQHQEKHHVSFSVWPARRPVLLVQSQTHSARKELDYVPGTPDSELTDPGITLRDIRMAVALEEKMRESGALFGQQTEVEGNTREQVTQLFAKERAWENLLSRHPWKE